MIKIDGKWKHTQIEIEKIKSYKKIKGIHRSSGTEFKNGNHTSGEFKKGEILWSKEHQVKAGMMTCYWENKKAEELKENYEHMFKPSVVCDRICIKDNKIIFVEIKQIRQKLRPKQREFKELCDKLGYEYIIEYIE